MYDLDHDETRKPFIVQPRGGSTPTRLIPARSSPDSGWWDRIPNALFSKQRLDEIDVEGEPDESAAREPLIGRRRRIRTRLESDALESLHFPVVNPSDELDVPPHLHAASKEEVVRRRC